MSLDEYSAKKLVGQLIGKTLKGWHIDAFINHGKSAVVFLASKGDLSSALKVFDPEIVKRYGHEKQKKRVERELSLIGKSHPNLASIYDGGEEEGYLFIIMEYFPGKNLADALLDIPASEIRSIIAQVSSAAQFLEEISFAHRDIKPENIGISPDMKTVKLLDFGVIRPFDLSNITDEGEQLQFIGTLQYSPPELLFREMDDGSIPAWRAISFYQIGGVMHDLLMRKPLFEESKHPYARLVRAVEKEIPLIDNPSADPDFRLLAQNCLFKSPGHRLETVKWEDFRTTKIADPMDSARRRIAQHRVAAVQVTELPPDPEDLLRTQIFSLSTQIFSAVVSATKTDCFPRYSTQIFNLSQPYLLGVFFEPSTKDGLNSYFALYCRGMILDPISSVLELQISACICSKSEAMPMGPKSGLGVRIIKGALIDQDIRQHIYESLLFFYAEALDSQLELGEEVKWL